MAANFLPTLRREIEALEAELASDPRFVKLKKLQDVLDVYERDTTSGKPSAKGMSFAKAARANYTVRQKILEMTREFLAQKEDPTPTRVIVEYVRAKGVEVPGKEPVSNLSAMLSNSSDFESHGRSGWTLVGSTRQKPVNPKTPPDLNDNKETELGDEDFDLDDDDVDPDDDGLNMTDSDTDEVEGHSQDSIFD